RLRLFPDREIRTRVLGRTPCRTRIAKVSRGGGRRNRRTGSGERRACFQSSPDPGTQERGRVSSAPSKSRRPQPSFSKPAREISGAARARVWYHDGPRVLSLSEPALAERIALHQAAKLSLAGLEQPVETTLKTIRDSLPAHRRAQLSFRIDPIWIFTGPTFPRRGYPAQRQRQHWRDQCVAKIARSGHGDPGARRPEGI